MGREPSRISVDQLSLPAAGNGLLTVLSDLLQGGQHNARLELRFAHPDGKTVQADTNVTILRSNDGGVEQLILQVADASEKKQAATSLQRAQKMEAIGQSCGYHSAMSWKE